MSSNGQFLGEDCRWCDEKHLICRMYGRLIARLHLIQARATTETV
jgi:hypothetical protein